MKPFNLTAAMRGEPIINRIGEEDIEFIAYVPEAGKYYQLVVRIGEFVQTFSVDGEWGNCTGDDRDLFMAPKKKTVWVNIYSDSFRPSDSFASGYMYETEIIADANSEKHRFGGRAWPMEIEE